MNRNTLIAFAAITLTVVITAVIVVSKERAPTAMKEEPLLPALVQNINKAASISLTSNRHKTILERDGETWRIANSDDYPALFDKVRTLLIDLAELRTLERKTNNPQLYHRLHVQDPSQPDSNSVLVTITDENSNVLADVIIGKSRISNATNLRTGLYVRKPHEEHALLVSGQAPVSAEKTAWFNPNILNIPSERIREVVIRHADGSVLRTSRDSPQSSFKIADLPADRKIQSQVALNRFGSVLQEISARDIRALESFDFPQDKVVETTVHTFDGLVANVRSMQLDDRRYANFQFSYDAETTDSIDRNSLDQLATESATEALEKESPAQPLSVEAEAHDLQQRLSGWVYQVPGFKYDVFSATLDDYTRVVND